MCVISSEQGKPIYTWVEEKAGIGVTNNRRT
jgi:hypothetical protein